MKKLLSLLIITLGALPDVNSQSPFPNPPMNTDAGNPFMRPGQPWTMSIPKTQVEKKSKLHPFKITLRDSTSMIVQGKIDCHGKNYYLAVDDATMFRSFPARETLSLQRLDISSEPGIANDSCWLFKKRGKINTYSVLTESDPRFIIAIQDSDGPILPLSKENLMPMMERPSAYVTQLIAQKKLHDAVIEYNKRNK
jgi:hypothetical protein